MLQKTYHFYNLEELNSIIEQIRSEAVYDTASGILMQLYNPRLDINEELLIENINKAFPKACISGITAANIAGDKCEEKCDFSNFPVELSVTFFKETQLEQYEFCMDSTTSFVAGRMMSEFLESLEDLKCLQMFYASNSISICVFKNEFKHHTVPIFGIKAGRHLSGCNIAKVYGRKVYTNGFVVIAFKSKSLKIYMDNNLGWTPIGREMAITKINSNNIIAEVDKRPATEIYEKYLKVTPNEYFFENVSDFPMIIERNGRQLARVAASYDKNGAIHLTSDVRVGDHFRLSYATPEQLFALTSQSATDLHAFKPEAVFLFECGNRVRFLKEQYDVEIEQYKKSHDQLSVATGYAELYSTTDEFGGELNSSLVAVGLKEDVNAEDVFIPRRMLEKDVNVHENENQEIPFIDRILAFLESTSKELDQTNRDLGKIAYTDQLTKIYNRWELEKKIDEYLELNRQGKSYGLLFFDIDHFKHVNDTYGHDVGDMVLLAVVNLVKEKLKEGHAFGRWGGEEFLYMVPAKNEEELFAFAEGIRKMIDEICFVTVQHLTISIGATMALPDDTMRSIVKRADDAVYVAKESGRNMVIIQ